MGCNSSIIPLKYDERDDIHIDSDNIFYKDDNKVTNKKYNFRDASISNSMGISGFGNLRDYGGWPSREITHSGWR